MWKERLLLYSLELTTDQDDKGLFGGDAEIMITVSTDHGGKAKCIWTFFIEDVNWDDKQGAVYDIFDGDLNDSTLTERKGGPQQIYDHIECDPKPGMTPTIRMDEINQGLGEIMGVIAAAAGLVKAPKNGGVHWGQAAVAVAKAVDSLLAGQDFLGSDTYAGGGPPKDATSPWRTPTQHFKYRMRYENEILHPDVCDSAVFQVRCQQQASNPALSQTERETYYLYYRGLDDDHPFTKYLPDAQTRYAYLYQALGLINDITDEPGTVLPRAANDKTALRLCLKEIARSSAETEVSEAMAGGVSPGIIASAQASISSGDLAYSQARYTDMLNAYGSAITSLMDLNHPSIKYFNLVHDPLSYPNGGLAGRGAWRAHSAPGSKPIQVSNGRAILQQSAGAGEDLNHPFRVQDVHARTYASFTLQVPSAAVGSINDYFVHFRPSGADSNNFVARTYVGPPTAGGDFTLGIAAGSLTTTPLAPWPSAMWFGEQYHVVIAYDGVAGTSTLWVNPTDKFNASVSSTSAPLANRTLANIALRQSSPTGANFTEIVDNVGVGTSMADAIVTSPTAVPFTTQWTLVILGAALSWAGMVYAARLASSMTNRGSHS